MKKQASKVLAIAPRDYPDPPDFPTEMTNTNMNAYRENFAAWWNTLKSKLREIDQDIEALKQK